VPPGTLQTDTPPASSLDRRSGRCDSSNFAGLEQLDEAFHRDDTVLDKGIAIDRKRRRDLAGMRCGGGLANSGIPRFEGNERDTGCVARRAMCASLAPSRKPSIKDQNCAHIRLADQIIDDIERGGHGLRCRTLTT